MARTNPKTYSACTVPAALVTDDRQDRERARQALPGLVALRDDAGDEALLCVLNNGRSQAYIESIAIRKEFAVENAAVEVTVDRADEAMLYLS